MHLLDLRVDWAARQSGFGRESNRIGVARESKDRESAAQREPFNRVVPLVRRPATVIAHITCADLQRWASLPSSGGSCDAFVHGIQSTPCDLGSQQAFASRSSLQYRGLTRTVVERGVHDALQVEPNVNGIEFDTLYLDMNAIIHPCCHPEHGLAPGSEAQMFRKIMDYIEWLFAVVRPRKLLFLAIDGVAPRAKINQQRARRFKSAQERAEAYQLALQTDPDALPPWDSNVITPGTPFMASLAAALREFICFKQNTAPAWKAISVIFSDANAPGEGEHKIMDFIRAQRLDPDYDATQHHVLYGLDADLIMLGLATHEPNFYLLREEQRARSSGRPQLEMLHIAALREHLGAELWVDCCPFVWSLERAIDDFVFLCFFVGNDFLPHLPSMRIQEGALDKLLQL